MHNQRQDVCDLYDYLWKINLKESELAKPSAWAVIYPQEKYNDGKMRQVLHLLLVAVENFLAYEQMQKNEGKSKLFLMQRLKERKLFSVLEQYITQAKILQKESPSQNWEDLRFAYELETIHFETAEQEQRTSPINLQELSDALDIQYFADKLRKVCLLYSRLTVVKMNYQPKMLEVVFNQVRELDYLKIPAIGIYYYCYQSLVATENADSYFEKMMAYLKDYATVFPPSEIRELYLLAINYTIKKLNAGSQWHLEKAFHLYKTGITDGYLLEENNITPFTYNNMVSIGIQMKDYQWIETFIFQYKEQIPKEQRDSIFQECLAKLYHAKKQYKQAQELLLQIDTKDILRLISCKILLAKIYYETDEIDALESLLESLKMYLRRKEIVGYHKENYNNCVQFIQKLARLNPFDKQAKAKLRAEIEQVKILSVKDWLLEQI